MHKIMGHYTSNARLTLLLKKVSTLSSEWHSDLESVIKCDRQREGERDWNDRR